MRNSKTGYVQGMNFLAGTLFLQCGFDSKLVNNVRPLDYKYLENCNRGRDIQYAHNNS